MKPDSYTPAKSVWTQDDLEEMSWHDCRVHGIGMVDDFEPHLHEFRLDIDYIFKWPGFCDGSEEQGFWVSPATLVFENPVEMSIKISDWLDTYILNVTRTGPHKSSDLEPQWVWQFDLSSGGRIKITSAKFTQYIRRAPIFLPSPSNQTLESGMRGGICFDKVAYDRPVGS